MTNIDLSCSRGDTQSWALHALLDSLPINLTGGRISMAARRNFASPVVFERTSDSGDGIVIAVDPATGMALITLRPDDTLMLPNELVCLVYTVRVTVPAGDWVVAQGKLQVNPVATP